MLVDKGGIESVGPEVVYLLEDDPGAEEAAASAARATESLMAEAGLPLPIRRNVSDGEDQND